MDLSIIFVNWNSVAYLRECIPSIYEHTRGISFELIVVDNASPDGQGRTIKDYFPEVTLIESSENLGFSKANNLGFRRSRGRYVLFLNPDTRLLNPAINILLEHGRTLPNAGIVGAKLLNSNLSIQTESIQRFPTILNQMMDIEYLRLRWPHCPLWSIGPLFAEGCEPTAVEVIPGACMLLEREVFAKAGGFSEEYFMYAEDIDLNYKVNRLGLKRYYVGAARVMHHGGRSSAQKVSHWVTKMQFRAMVMFHRKTRGRLYATTYRGAIAAAAIGRLTALALATPFASVISSKERLRWASGKWSTVLKCAFGVGN